MYLEPGALSVLYGDLYPELHEIENLEQDAIGPFLSNYQNLSLSVQNTVITRSKRVSFTLRQVKNVRKISKFLRLPK